jgi:hypothetical protein
MSEFKFACPVCGQHMMCDVSQGGSVMVCPTCFQKIVAPQAPADADQKILLTGTKLTDKKIPTPVMSASGRLAPAKKSPLGPVIGLVIVLAAGAAVFVNRDKIFNTNKAPANPTNAVTTSSTGPGVTRASDKFWMLTLDTNAIPDSPATGRIHGQDFIVERCAFFNGNLAMRQGMHGPMDFGLVINFGGAQPESLSGNSINVTAEAAQAARVTLVWRNHTGTMKETFTNGYAMRLEFGAIDHNHLPGKIYLCTPDAEKSYLMGTFHAFIVKARPRH